MFSLESGSSSLHESESTVATPSTSMQQRGADAAVQREKQTPEAAASAEFLQQIMLKPCQLDA